MRDTKQRLKLNGRVLASICVLILLVVLFGCDSTGAGGLNDGSESNLVESDGSESPGEALVLPEGNITGWDLGARDVGVTLMNADANPVHGYGPVTVQDNGDFPGMTIDPPPAEALLSWDDFQWVYCYELHNMQVSITDDSVRFQSFCNVDVDDLNEILRGSGDGTAEVSWIYADGSTAISGVFSDGSQTAEVDLQLDTGWNLAVFQDDGSGTITLKTETEPAGTEWHLN